MMTYGYTVQDDDDGLVTVVENVAVGFQIATAPTSFLVHIFPSLQYLPKSFPGMVRYWRTVEYWKLYVRRMTEEPFQFVKDQLVS